jgi:hypothetical protein
MLPHILPVRGRIGEDERGVLRADIQVYDVASLRPLPGSAWLRVMPGNVANR